MSDHMKPGIGKTDVQHFLSDDDVDIFDIEVLEERRWCLNCVFVTGCIWAAMGTTNVAMGCGLHMKDRNAINLESVARVKKMIRIMEGKSEKITYDDIPF